MVIESKVWESTTQATDLNFDDPSLRSGMVSDGVYQDQIYALHGEIPTDWAVEYGGTYESFRLRLISPEKDVKIEIWRFRDIILQPAPNPNCMWSFIDRGFYAADQQKTLVTTCFPNTPADSFIFAYIHHWGRGSWQFEIHTSQADYWEGKQKGDAILRNFHWSDDNTPVLGPKE